MKLFEIVDTKKEFEKLNNKCSEKLAKVKSEEEQYQEKASQILNCTPLTSSVSIELIESTSEQGGGELLKGTQHGSVTVGFALI